MSKNLKITLVLLMTMQLLMSTYAARSYAFYSPTQKESAMQDELAKAIQQNKFMATDGAASDAFGRGVAISANTAIIGSPLTDVNGKADQGVVYVYVYSNGVWTPQAKLIAPDGNVNSQFGFTVAIEGDTVVVGARRTDPGDRGAAYVFVRSGASWAPQAKLTANDGVNGDRFGEAIGISSNTVVVGAPLHDIASTPDGNKGAAYVFIHTNGTWTQQAKLIANDAQDFDFFGASVAIDADTVIVGAPDRSGIGDFNPGSAYVFTRAGTIWKQEAKLLANDGAHNNAFGAAVSISSETAVIGASSATVAGAAFAGAAYVFIRSNANWTQQAKLHAEVPANSDLFGGSVSLKKDQLAIGAYGTRIDGKVGQGSVYLFNRTGNVWNKQDILTANDGAASDNFGTAVALDANFVVAGTPQKGVNFSNNVDTQQHGAAYIFSSNLSDGTPQILEIKVKGKKLIITGANFEAPTEIYLNGEKQKKTTNDEENPTTIVIALKAGKLIAPGQTVLVQVKNANTGETSDELLFTRPVE